MRRATESKNFRRNCVKVVDFGDKNRGMSI